MQKLVLLFIVLAVSSGCDRPPHPQQAVLNGKTMGGSVIDPSKLQSSPDAASAPYELQFLDTMTALNEASIDMALLVDTRAQHSEIKKLAKDILTGRRSETTELKKLRGDSFAGALAAINIDLAGVQRSISEIDLDKLDTLKENAFDLEFIRQMTAHNEGVGVLANDVINRAASGPDVKPETVRKITSLARSVIDTRTAEMAQMNTWQQQWKR